MLAKLIEWSIHNKFIVILLTLFYVVGMLPIVTGMTLQYVTILGNAVGIIFGIIPVLLIGIRLFVSYRQPKSDDLFLAGGFAKNR